MQFGQYKVENITCGHLRLDGGSMFGVVPKVLWEKKARADRKNRIYMAMNVLLITSPDLNILVDTGSGSKEDARFRNMYSLTEPVLLQALTERGLAPGDIDLVVNTHLHFDHAGGNTIKLDDGSVSPAFPNATYVVQRREYEDAVAAGERSKASYFPWNYVPLAESGRLQLLEGEKVLADGITAYPLPGHTMGMQGVKITGGGKTALYLADCIPTSHHIPLPWIMSYDLYPLTTLETKKVVLPVAAEEKWTLFFEHDPEVIAARLEETGPFKYRVIPVEEVDG